MKASVSHEVIYWKPEETVSETLSLVGEALLSIMVQGQPGSAGMRTPGEEIAHAAGFCLAEGFAESAEDIASISYVPESAPNLVQVTLSPARWEKIYPVLAEKGNKVSGFGQSPEDAVEFLVNTLRPLPEGKKISLRRGFACLEDLNRHQPLRKQTHATHATAIVTPDMEMLAIAEDVGRHNGMDKAIGKVLLDRKLAKAGALLLSSRISFDLVQKGARAGIPVMLSVSRPTALAVNLASRLNMSLACLARGGGGYVFCGKERMEEC
ncbi:MAG: formate dehydrogenase accessory sulfurtransferase FdhD [Desulfococcaceae bacterium]